MKPVQGQNKKRGPERSERRKVAEAAGLTRLQAWQYIQIARIPEPIFEALVESEDPPSTAKLVEVARLLQGKPPSKARGRRYSTCPHCGADLKAGGPDHAEA